MMKQYDKPGMRRRYLIPSVRPVDLGEESNFLTSLPPIIEDDDEFDW